MNKNAIKKFATEARRELISRVGQRALKYGISDKEVGNPSDDSVNGHLLSSTEKKQRSALIEQIKEKGYEQVMEEVAYTWFNRFSALRFMEVNGYLPSRVRVFTDESNAFKPQILTEAIHLELDGLDMEKVYAYKEANDNDELYKYLLITQCNALNSVLPGMFQKISDYTEILFPDNLLREGSVIQQMIELIPEEDWQDQVQIIGWLYQYYNTELNEMVYDGNLSKICVEKDLLPAATTIYTPDWAVKYMVDNSLGRLWIEGHPNNELKSQWKYYLEEAQQEFGTQEKLTELRKEYANLNPEDIRVIDPCQGSGHILIYMFDMLVQIYEAHGVQTKDAVKSIIENNIYGLDIDDRAAQLAYFSVMMKACEYDKRFLRRKVQPHVYSIVESNYVNHEAVQYFCNGDTKLENAMNTIIEELRDAKEYGSIITVSQQDWAALYTRFDEIENESAISIYTDAVLELRNIVLVAEVLAQKYSIVVTNPPYLGMSRYSPKLASYVKTYYPQEKTDLSMVLLKKSVSSFVEKNGFVAFITTSSWMFLSSFDKVRSYLYNSVSFDSLVDFGTELFDGKVGHNPIVSWVMRKSTINSNMTAIRLVDYCYSQRDRKEPEFFEKRNYYIANQSDFHKIPGFPVAYWVSRQFVDNFLSKKVSSEFFSGGRNKTHGNEKYIREWWEISNRRKWQLYVKGGEYRRWYGNHEYVVDWSDEAKAEYASHGGLYNQDYAGKTGICWTLITSSKTSFRVKVPDAHYDSGAPTIFNDEYSLDEYLLGFLNSNVATAYLELLNPSMNMGNTYVLSLPLIRKETVVEEVKNLVRENIKLAKLDWDSFENSMDFASHPLAIIDKFGLLKDAFAEWDDLTLKRFSIMRRNEERLNEIFVDVYGLEKNVSDIVPDKDISIKKADVITDIKSFISYAVGCMFGRYSIDVEGLVYADGEWDSSKYETFKADKDNIIPICDDEYFDDDIVGRFVEFVKVVYGAETLEENLKFIADALGGKGSPREVIRNYFINDFYKDHCKTYQKRPIYWLFDSGKKNGFKCLIYMHRYQPDTIARIRTDYVHEQQSRYRTAIADLENRIANASTSERVKLNKQLKTLNDQATEIHEYEEKIHHLADQMISIDLDDGVKVNYAKFQDVLAKIK